MQLKACDIVQKSFQGTLTAKCIIYSETGNYNGKIIRKNRME
jgi:hypothetical protein